MTQYVYVFSNPAFSNLVKIGKTRDPSRRIKELSAATGVPAPYECMGVFQVKDMDKAEAALHLAFDSNRFNPKREFFKKDYEDIYPLLSLLGREVPTVMNIDREDQEELKGVQYKSRPRLSFMKLEIPVGSILHYRDGDQQCTVVDDTQVRYNEKVWYLSPLTQHIMEVDRPLRGAAYWKYENRLLSHLYEEYYV